MLAIAIRERVLALAPGGWRDEMYLAREHSQHALAYRNGAIRRARG